MNYKIYLPTESSKPEIWEWDTDRYLVVPNEYVGCYTHFYNRASTGITKSPSDYKVVGGVAIVLIPPEILQGDYPMYVYACNEKNGKFITESLTMFQVKSRPKPTNYVFEPSEVLSWSELDNKKLDKPANEGKPNYFLSRDDSGDTVWYSPNDCTPNIKKGERTYYKEYTTYSYADGEEFMQKHYKPSSIGSCSVVVKEDLVGRNYDWKYGEEPSIVISTKASEGRFSTIGVAHCLPGLTDEVVNKGTPNELYRILPFMVNDILNENGVYCSINVVHTGDKGSTLGTNPDKEDLCMLMIPRFIGDFGESAKDSISLLEERNIYAPLKDLGIEAHFCICDKENTYFVEFINNAMVVFSDTDSDYEEVPNNLAILVNTYLEDWNGEVKTVFLGNTLEETESTGLSLHPMGLERYLILSEAYESITDSASMKTVLESVKYTNTYEDGYCWLSEFTQKEGENSFGELNIYNTAEDFSPIVTWSKEKYQQRERNGETWYTAHSSIYNLDKLTLELYTEEDYSSVIKFALGSGEASTGTTDYNDLENKPKINNVTLSGSKSLDDLGVASDGEVELVKADISEIKGKIPAQASTANQLADKAFVNSTVGTNTAVFRGTFNSVAELNAYSGDKTNNDYAFVIIYDETVITEVKAYDRYKYNGTSWVFEYELNNSSFTAVQWSAINSGITSGSVGLIETAIQPDDLSEYATKIELESKYTKPSSGIPKSDLSTNVQNSLELADTSLQEDDVVEASYVSIDSAVTEDSTNIVTSGAVYTAITSAIGNIDTLVGSGVIE